MLSGFAEKFREESFENIPQESDHQPKPHSCHVQNLDIGCICSGYNFWYPVKIVANGIHPKFMWGHVIVNQLIQIVFRTREIAEPSV